MREGNQLQDVTSLAVPRVGRVEETGDPSRPYRLLDRDGVEVAAVSEFLLDMLADDDSPASLYARTRTSCWLGSGSCGLSRFRGSVRAGWRPGTLPCG